jgi:hypothetical protein
MDHRFNLRIIEHSTNIQPDKRGKSTITFQCSSLAIKLHFASLVSAKTTLKAIEWRYISGKILRLSQGKMHGMAYQVIKQALVWTKQETQLSYEIEHRIIAGYLGNIMKLTQLGRVDFT